MQLSTLVQGIDPEKPWAIHINTLFLLRRFYYTLLFAWPQPLHMIQLSLNLIHCILQLGYLIKVRPYIDKKSNYQEMFNEVCIFLVACLLYGLTDQVSDFHVRMRVSWAIIFIIIAQIFINICLIIYVWIIDIKALIARYQSQRRASKYDDKNITELSDLKVNNKFETINTHSDQKFNKASIKDFIINGVNDEEEIKEGEPVQDYQKLDNTDIGRPSDHMTPISDMNFDDDPYETNQMQPNIKEGKARKGIANRATGVRGS